MDIGAILSRAWQIIWNNKVLWIFGILAGCASTNAGTSNYRLSYEEELSPRFQNLLNQIPDWQIALIVGLIILAVLVLVVVAVFLGTIGRIGLIRGTLLAEQGVSPLTFGELFNGSVPYFWRVFGLNLLVGLAAGLILAAFIVFTVLGSILTLGLLAVCLVPIFCLIVPIGWFINIIVEQASIAIVVENLGIVAGLQRGWEVVKNNLGSIIVMALILILGIGLIGGFIIGLPLAALLGPAILGAIAGTEQSVRGGFLASGLCLVAYLPLLLLLNGILQSYIKSAWTLTFLRLTGRPAQAGAQVFPVEA